MFETCGEVYTRHKNKSMSGAKKLRFGFLFVYNLPIKVFHRFLTLFELSPVFGNRL
jgi:hypothetical protein